MLAPLVPGASLDGPLPWSQVKVPPRSGKFTLRATTIPLLPSAIALTLLSPHHHSSSLTLGTLTSTQNPIRSLSTLTESYLSGPHLYQCSP